MMATPFIISIIIVLGFVLCLAIVFFMVYKKYLLASGLLAGVLLAGIVIVIIKANFVRPIIRTNESVAKVAISHLASALDLYNAKHKCLPTTEQGLKALVVTPTNMTNWKGPYLDKSWLIDPWGRQYVYRYPGIHNPILFDIFSLGPDGIESEDDIGNWQFPNMVDSKNTISEPPKDANPNPNPEKPKDEK